MTFLNSLFRRPAVETGTGGVAVPDNGVTADKNERPQREVVQRRRKGDKWRPVTVREKQSLYERPDSFTDLLPWVECDDNRGVFLLEDGRSCGVMFELIPIATEARSKQSLQEVANGLRGVVTEAVPEIRDGPWIFQFYAQYEPAKDFQHELDSYYGEHAGAGSEYSEAFKELMHAHLDAISRSDGLFDDPSGADGRWRGRILRIRAVLYRKQPGRASGDPFAPLLAATIEADEIAKKLEESFASIGLRSTRGNSHALYRWMLPWLNPRPEVADGDPWKLLEIAGFPQMLEMPGGRDLGELLTFSMCSSDQEKGTWEFDGLLHRAITIQGQRNAPVVGHLTGERKMGNSTTSLLDRMPEGSIIAMTVVIKPQDLVSNQISRIASAATAGGYEAEAAAEEADHAKKAMARNEKLYPTNLVVYVRGDTERQLTHRTNQVEALLVANSLTPIKREYDLLAVDAWVRNLPMNFDVDFDARFAKRARLTYSSHIAAMAPVYGRARGTGHPGFTFFNRGAEPLTLDPLNRNDRKQNGHMLVLGPTGAGKSAMLVYLLMQMMAIYRPRIFILEAGNSFGLLGKYFASQGLSVNQVSITAKTDVSLPPFSDAIRVYEEEQELRFGSADRLVADEDWVGETIQDDDEENTDDEDERDMLGEMEIAARVLITGGNIREDERLDRADSMTIKQAILGAAKTVIEAGREQVLTEDVVLAFREMASDPDRSEAFRNRTEKMAASMENNCNGLAGRLFNRPGTLWPEQDVTILDFGILAREGYEDKLTPAYLGVMNRINALVEKYQHDKRPTIVVTDEAHIITTNPMLAPYVVKITKMWRKYGAWFWAGTQNLEDFPDSAKKMLNMMEWWICLSMPKEEVEQLARFKKLTEEQREMLLSARKEPGKYVEGVAMATNLQLLFRSVVPPLCLALAMTEKDEKAVRSDIMRKTGCTEIEAAYEVARLIEAGRGL